MAGKERVERAWRGPPSSSFWPSSLWLGGAWEAPAQESLPLLVKRIQPAVVTVVAYDEKGEVPQQGSGFFVINKAGHLIANRHVPQGGHTSMRSPISDRLRTWMHGSKITREVEGPGCCR